VDSFIISAIQQNLNKFLETRKFSCTKSCKDATFCLIM